MREVGRILVWRGEDLGVICVPGGICVGGQRGGQMSMVKADGHSGCLGVMLDESV